MIDKNRYDVAYLFQVYVVLVGDVQKVAAATDLPEEVIQELADSEGWTEKVRRISVQSRSGKPGDWERAQNRALNFVQVHQLRRSLDHVIAHITKKVGENQMLELIQHNTADTTNYTAKLFTELAKALQSLHEMSYSALGDTVRERDAEGDGKDTALAAASLHATVIGALNRAKTQDSTSESLVKEATAKLIELKSVAPTHADTPSH